MEKGKHKPFLSSNVGTIIYGSLRETGQIVSRPFKFWIRTRAVKFKGERDNHWTTTRRLINAAKDFF